MSLMLSLPDTWDYTTKGLAAISKDGVDAITSAIKELEGHGYITRKRLRDSFGRMADIEYTIHEKPVSPKRENSRLDNPSLENPRLDNPGLGILEQENPAQSNTNAESTKEENTYVQG